MTPLTKKQKWTRFILTLLMAEAHFGAMMWYMMTTKPGHWTDYVFAVVGLVSMVALWSWFYTFNRVPFPAARKS